MTKIEIMKAIVDNEEKFDQAMEIIARKASPSWVDHGMNIASQSASILVELRHRLAQSEDPK